jgi:hypothetical protein
MRIIITGGTGLIGTVLSKKLLEDGHEVIVLSRNPAKAKMPNGVRAEKWDAKTPDGWGSLINNDTAIVNLAGAGIADKRWSEERKKLLHDSRVDAGQAVTKAIVTAEQKPKVLIQSSAIGFYGTHDDIKFTEDDNAGNDFMAKLCQEWETSTASVEEMGVRRVIIRTGVVLSNDGGAFPRMSLPFKLFVGGPVGKGKQWLSWIHIDDTVNGIRYFIGNENTSGVYNLTAPHPHTNKQFGKVIGKVLGRPSFMPVPGFAMKLLFGEMSVVLLEGQQVLPAKLEATDFSFKYPELETALRELLGKQIT